LAAILLWVLGETSLKEEKRKQATQHRKNNEEGISLNKEEALLTKNVFYCVSLPAIAYNTLDTCSSKN